MSGADLFVAKESATFEHNGQPIFLTAGVTLVRAGHPILKGHEGLFEPVRVHYEVAQPKAGDDDGAPASPVRADHRGARTRTAGTG